MGCKDLKGAEEFAMLYVIFFSMFCCCACLCTTVQAHFGFGRERGMDHDLGEFDGGWSVFGCCRDCVKGHGGEEDDRSSRSSRSPPLSGTSTPVDTDGEEPEED